MDTGIDGVDTVGDLFPRKRRSERPALVDPAGRTYDYHWLCTSAWKAGNFLRHAGVRRGVTVGIEGSGPFALLGFFGAAMLEATIRFDPPTAFVDEEVRAVLAPSDRIDRYDLARGSQLVGYGSKPDDPSVHHFDAGLWSENPSFPPVEFDPEAPAITDGERTFTHRTIVEAAMDVVSERNLGRGDRVSVDEPVSNPRTIVAGVVAPLVAEGVIVLGGDGRSTVSR